MRHEDRLQGQYPDHVHDGVHDDVCDEPEEGNSDVNASEKLLGCLDHWSTDMHDEADDVEAYRDYYEIFRHLILTT